MSITRPAVWALLIVGSLLVWAAVCVAVIVAIDHHDSPTLYRFCDGHMKQVAVVTPCPNGELRMIA